MGQARDIRGGRNTFTLLRTVVLLPVSLARRPRRGLGMILSLLCAGVVHGVGAATSAAASDPLQRIGHIVVIIEENRSFDNLFGLYPGANGLTEAARAPRQVDATGKLMQTLPPVMDTSSRPPRSDHRFPSDLPNAPFQIDRYLPAPIPTSDLVHRYYAEQAQINAGRMDKFAVVSDAGGLTLGYYDSKNTALWRWASTYTLADNAFHSVYGGSMTNHAYLICACVLRWPDAPAALRVPADANDPEHHEAAVTADGYVVNTAHSIQFHPPQMPDTAHYVPPQTLPHIGDRLTAKGISWKWYAGGYRQALAGKPDRLFQYHHQPFNYFQNMAPGALHQHEHLQDLDELYTDLATNRLPAVSFYKPTGQWNMHPGYASATPGDAHLDELLKRLTASSAWKDMLVVVIYDENGGFWDHVPPPKRDRWGPGTRVPLLLIGPTVKRGFVDHTQYEFASILRTIEERYRLEPLNEADKHAQSFRNALLAGVR
jgi:phospholipase C